MIDSTYIFSFAQLDSMRFVLDTTSVSGVSTNAESKQDVLYQISEKISSIKQVGIGYHDVVAIIAIPLIIAIFAFTFMFLFDASNRVNTKYDSVNITNLFTNQKSYKRLIPVSKVSLLCVLLYGVFSLFLEDKKFWQDYVLFFDLVLIIVAGLYSFEIFVFTKECIRFNNPFEILRIIEKGVYVKSGGIVQKLKYNVLNVLTFNSRHRKLKAQGEKLMTSFGTDAIRRDQIDKIVDIFSYAVSHNDNGLFGNVLKSIQRFVDIENGLKMSTETGYIHCYSNLFYDKVIEGVDTDCFTPLMQDGFLKKYLNRFHQLHFISEGDLKSITKQLVALVNKNNVSFLEKYILYSERAFHNLLDIPRKAYILGYRQEEIEQYEKSTVENWECICNYSYILLSYAFSKGCYPMIDQALLCKVSKIHDLYPVERKDILYRYSQCLKSIEEYTICDSIDARYIFSKNIDVVSLLNNYTAFLLLYRGGFKGGCLGFDKLHTQYLHDLKSASSIVKSDISILAHYPQIRDNILSFTEAEGKDVCGKIDITEFIETKLRKGLMHFILQMINPNGVTQPKSDNTENTTDNKGRSHHNCNSIDDTISQLKNLFCNNAPDFGKDIEKLRFPQCSGNADSSIEIEPFAFSLYFRTAPTNAYHIYRKVINIIASRVMYAYLTALSSNMAEEKSVSIADLPKYIKKTTKGKFDDYWIFHIDKKMETCGTDTFDISSSNYEYMNGLPVFEKLGAHILLVKKNQAPYIELLKDCSPLEMLQDAIPEESNEYAKLSTKINYGITIHYDSSADVKFIKLKPITVMYKPKRGKFL